MAWAPALGWLFLGRVISGLTASSIPTAMAYMADVTPREKRATAFGLLNAAFGMGFVLGPALGGLLGTVNPRLPFWVAGALSLINGLYGLLVLPESLPRHHRSPFSWKRANPVGSLVAGTRRPAASRLYRAAVPHERLRHLRGLPLSLDRPHRRPLARHRRHLLRTLRSAPGQARCGEVRRARIHLRRPHLRRAGLRPVRTLEDRPALLAGHPRP
jgi:MFS family permease